MDVQKLAATVEMIALESDRDAAGRVLMVYIAPGDGGLWVSRVGCGLHQLGGGDEDFKSSMVAAVERLWPESSKKTRQWLQIAGDFLARSPIGRMLAGSADDDDDDDAAA